MHSHRKVFFAGWLGLSATILISMFLPPLSGFTLLFTPLLLANDAGGKIARLAGVSADTVPSAFGWCTFFVAFASLSAYYCAAFLPFAVPSRHLKRKIVISVCWLLIFLIGGVALAALGFMKVGLVVPTH